MFLKEGEKVNNGKVKICSKIKDENRRLAAGENEEQSTGKGYLEDLCNMNT